MKPVGKISVLGFTRRPPGGKDRRIISFRLSIHKSCKNLSAFFAWVFSPRALRETRWQDLSIGFHAKAAGRQSSQKNLTQALSTQVLKKSFRVLCVGIFSA